MTGPSTTKALKFCFYEALDPEVVSSFQCFNRV